MELQYSYEYDIPNIINNKSYIPNDNYTHKIEKINSQIYNYRQEYLKKDYGSILYNIKIKNLQLQKTKYQYLNSLQIFYQNNNVYFPNLIVVDMHQLHAEQMIQILNVLYNYWYQKNINKIKIITGNGNQILYKKLINYLNYWKIKYKDNQNNVDIALFNYTDRHLK